MLALTRKKGEVYLQIQNENKAALNATDAMEALKNLF